MLTKKIRYIGAILIFGMLILLLGAWLLKNWNPRRETAEEPQIPSDPLADHSCQISTGDTSHMEVIIVAIRAKKTDDGGSDEDEPYIEVYRGVGIGQVYYDKVELADINPGDTHLLNQTIYSGPDDLLGHRAVVLDFWDRDAVSAPDHLGGPVSVIYEPATPGGGKIYLWPDTGERQEHSEPPNQSMVMCKYEIDGQDDQYEMSFRVKAY